LQGKGRGPLAAERAPSEKKTDVKGRGRKKKSATHLCQGKNPLTEGEGKDDQIFRVESKEIWGEEKKGRPSIGQLAGKRVSRGVRKNEGYDYAPARGGES